MEEGKDIKISRVNRGVEKALHLALPNDVNIWMKEEDLNQMARDIPEGYLRRIEGIQEILKVPDFVGYSDEEDRLIYVKEFFNNGRFKKAAVSIRHEGNPKSWVYEKLWWPEEASLLPLAGKNGFARFVK